MKPTLVKVLFGLSIVLLICFLGGLVYIHYDYYNKTLPSYGSTPIDVYYVIHGVIFLIPSILCFVISLILNFTVKKK
ncbi:hypothetical protein EDD66_10791 [Mobilisporobacter senegalensis]|uniref:Uncharacterized protein n=1 Tax=Mobilisporobacter senegalensis TaxID=1329262 RepID=A0A3N1XQV2_9FIRM|nr:hypothetical protein [Mobilisporobacter senegalensis]ROR27177.1 hypothetical protein EDD66_10791 [Mobilisporobacter senegalensis]